MDSNKCWIHRVGATRKGGVGLDSSSVLLGGVSLKFGQTSFISTPLSSYYFLTSLEFS